jgi:hypothetical protein
MSIDQEKPDVDCEPAVKGSTQVSTFIYLGSSSGVEQCIVFLVIVFQPLSDRRDNRRQKPERKVY